jgi:ankyrin repeat protein
MELLYLPDNCVINPTDKEYSQIFHAIFRTKLQELIMGKKTDDEIFKEIDEGSSVYERTANDLSCLCLAVLSRLTNVVEKILGIYKKDVELLKSNGWIAKDHCVLIAFGKEQIEKVNEKLKNLSDPEAKEKKIFILCKENNSSPVEVKILHSQEGDANKTILEIIEMLYDNGTVDIQYEPFIENSILHFAAFEGYMNVIEAFIEFGEDYKSENIRGINPFGYACMNNQVEIMKFFQQKFPTDIWETLTLNKEILFGLAGSGSWEAFEYLLKEIEAKGGNNAKELYDFIIESDNGNLLYAALANKKEDFVLKSLEKYPDVSKVNESGDNVLHCAMAIQLRELSKKLMEKYPDLLFQEDKNKRTPFHVLASNGWFDELKDVYEKYSDKKQEFFKSSEIIGDVVEMCLTNMSFDVATFLLEQHPDLLNTIEMITKLFGRAIVLPGAVDFLKTLKKLENFSIDLNTPDSSGNYYLIQALRDADYKNYQFLVENFEVQDYKKIIDHSEKANLLHFTISGSYKDDQSEEEKEIYYKIFNELLEKGVDVHHKTSFGKSLLHQAVLYDRPKIITKLLELGLKIEDTDDEGRNALHFVTTPETLRMLMEKTDHKNINVKGECGWTPLASFLLRLQFTEKFKYNEDMLKEFLKYKPDLNIQDNNYYTCLHLAPTAEIVKSFIENGADLNVLNNDGENILAKALIAESRSSELEKFYIQNLKIESKAEDGKEVFKLVYHPNASTESDDHFYIELLKTFRKNVDVSEYQGLLFRNLVGEDDSFTVALKLLELDVDVQFKDAENSNLLHNMSFTDPENSPKVAKILIEKGVDINEENVFGKTPLIQSIESIDFEKAAFLIRQPNVDLNKQDLNGNTALHHIALLQHGKTISALLAHGADHKLLNKAQRNFYDWLNSYNKKLFYFYSANQYLKFL